MHARGGIRTRNPSKGVSAGLRLRPRGQPPWLCEVCLDVFRLALLNSVAAYLRPLVEISTLTLVVLLRFLLVSSVPTD